MSDSLKEKSIKGVSWSFVEQVLTRGVNFVIGIILARLLSPTDYGLVGMISVFIVVSQIFIDGGLASALIREKDASEVDYSTVFITNITLSIIFYFLLFFSAPVIANFYNQPLLQPLLRVVSLSLVIGALSSVHGTVITKRVDFKSKTLISILTAIISGAAGIFCAVKGFGVWALVAQTLTAAVVVTVVTILLAHWRPRAGFSKESFKRLFSFSSKILGSSLIHTLYENAYPLVIGKKFSARDVGLFSRGGQFPSVANQTLVSTFNRVAYPVLSQIQDDDRHLMRAYEKYIEVFCFLAFPILMGLCGCAKPLILLLLTDKWMDCIPMMQIFCFSFLPNGLVLINLNLLYVKGRSDLALRMEIIKKTIMFSVLLITMYFGLMAICYGLIVNAFIDLYFSSFYTKKILDYSLWQQLRSIFPYFLVSLVVLVESHFISYLIDSYLIAIIVSAVVCILSYWGISKLVKLSAYQEVIDGLKPFLSRFRR